MGHDETAKQLSPAHGTSIAQVVERACARIAPTWPLDRFIAVNPLWGFVERPLEEVSAQLSALSGSRMLMPRAWYRQQWREGRLRIEHLRAAIVLTESPASPDEIVALLEADEPQVRRRARVMDVFDAKRDLVHEMSWRDFVTHSTSQFCAAYFDHGQAQLGPTRQDGLYASFHRAARHDHSPALLMGFSRFTQAAQALPGDANELVHTALVELGIPEPERESYLTALLLDLNGWAAWCAYLRFTARLEGRDDEHIAELLAVRLAWELLLHREGGRSVASRWQMEIASWPAIDRAAEAAQVHDWVLQRALELAYQTQICRELPRGLDTGRAAAPSAQVAFCIDVRSEVFRRALEARDPSLATLGFAGFFGLPIEYQPLASCDARPQLPGLLAPKMRVTDTGVDDPLSERRARRLGLNAAWKQFKTNAVSGFSFVESIGLFYAGKLVGDGLGLTRPLSSPERAGLTRAEHGRRKPRLTALAGGGELPLSARQDLAAGILRAMSLTRGFARLVVLVGHGSETVNNPHAAGLDCGACCGQTGEVNARAVAALLNEPAVRVGLRERGIDVPETTWFVAGQHNTTTDDVALFDLDELPSTHRDEVGTLRTSLETAGRLARRERAPRLGLRDLDDRSLDEAVRARARDWSEVRPEWGLSGCAAFIVAPREHTRHLTLEGRSFLHDYRWEEDSGFGVLELIMTAPMVVTHWINFQYYASTVDNLRYGSGNKVLHNVVGGHLGVFEGNGGDLRIGLSLQSLHDGTRWVHEPLRLSVFIEAPRDAMDAVLHKHEKVRHLVENGWIHLFQLDPSERVVYARRRGTWMLA